jgi:hypothetical protein
MVGCRSVVYALLLLGGAGWPVGAFAQALAGYVQADFVRSQESQDQLNQGSGQPLNVDRFLIRRARLKLSDAWAHAEYAAEADLNTVQGPQLGIRHLEVALGWPRRAAPPPIARADQTAPERAPEPASPDLQVRLGAGVFRAPFGHDVYELSAAERLFAEPSLLSQALFPGEYDVGARLTVRYRTLGLTLAAQNGEPIGSRPFPGRDPNAAKDLFARFTGGGALHPRVQVQGGLSTTFGQGFHPGILPGKDVLVWRDLNEDGILQPTELQLIRGASGTPAENFERWGLGADLQLRAQLPFWGALHFTAEAAATQNLDRGLRPSSPVLLGRPERGLAAYASLTQEVGRYALVGVRGDFYQPSMDQAGMQGGELVRQREVFTAYSAAAAVRFGEQEGRRGRLMAEYTHRQDPLGRSAAGAPADLANDSLTLRLQVEF